jgi:hypothetical protein
MLIFKTLTVRNFLSVGDTPIEIDLNCSRTTLVVGTNGTGKCLRGNTNIDIEFIDPDTLEKFKSFMKDRY